MLPGLGIVAVESGHQGLTGVLHAGLAGEELQAMVAEAAMADRAVVAHPEVVVKPY